MRHSSTLFIDLPEGCWFRGIRAAIRRKLRIYASPTEIANHLIYEMEEEEAFFWRHMDYDSVRVYEEPFYDNIVERFGLNDLENPHTPSCYADYSVVHVVRCIWLWFNDPR